MKRGPRSLFLASAAFTLAISAVGPAQAYQTPGRTSRVSVSSEGAEADEWSGVASITPDGRFITFVSWAKTLVEGDTNEQADIFVHDRGTATTERVSLGRQGAQADDWSWAPSITADGRWVAFESNASNLAPGDTNGAVDAYLRDRQTGLVERISVSEDGGDPNHHSGGPKLSPDARYVVFHSVASNLVPGDTNGKTDVFLRDRANGTTERVSIASDEQQGSENSYSGEITPDGRYVVFASEAPDLVSGDDNEVEDIFVRDRTTGTTELISLALDGSAADGMSLGADITPDGRHVAFHSKASNLVPRDTNGVDDTFVRDRVEQRTERVSLTSAGVQTGGYSHYPTISDDGRFVSFTSGANTLTPNDTNFRADAFVHDRLIGTTDRISVSSDGTTGNHESTSPSLSADGRFVSFNSRASNLVPGDTNFSAFSADVFVRDRGPAVGIGEIEAKRAGNLLEVSGWASFGGRVLSGAVDPVDDALPGAREIGAEIVGAELVHRVEDESLLARVRLAELPTARPPTIECPLPFGQDCPGVPEGITGAPGTTMGVGFSVGGTSYEARAIPASATVGAGSTFELLRCDIACERIESLTGSVGTSGLEARIRIPLSSLAGGGIGPITGIEVATAVGESGAPLGAPLDTLALPSSEVTNPEVLLAIAPAEQQGSEVAADLAEGSFVQMLQLPSPGSYTLTARACVKDRCGMRALPLTV